MSLSSGGLKRKAEQWRKKWLVTGILGCRTAAATFFFSSVKCHDTSGSHIQPSMFINPRNNQLAFIYSDAPAD